MKVFIKRVDLVWVFEADHEVNHRIWYNKCLRNSDLLHCSSCGRMLNTYYSLIIKKIGKHLPMEFKHMCCSCLLV